jgi:RHS repeat-associated protein
MLCTGAGWVDPRLFFVSTGTQTIKHDRRYDQLFANNTAGGDIGGMSGTIQKAGNISQLAWRVRGRERQSYSFSYDHLSRLTAATYYDVSGSNTATNTNLFNESLTYDLRGNIATLQRQGFYSSTCGYGQIDNLSYTYNTNTNQISSITDNALLSQRSHGFNPGAGGAGYTYDLNGNLKTDSYKGITNINYNQFNLPTTITFSSGNSIEYKYDATGNKSYKTVKVGSTTQYEHYYLPGGIEYRKTGTGNNRIEAIYHAEGRYFNTNVDASDSPTWQKEYTLKDHLGNARITFTDKNGNGIVDVPTDIVQENHYYPFGYNYEGAWRMNDVGRDHKYQYNYKELHDDFGFNLYAYGARYYDAAIGRFTGVDPIADQFAWVSPFNYAENEPIANIDLHGLQKVSIHLIGVAKTNDPKTGKVTETHVAAALSLDQGNRNTVNFGVSLNGLAIGGEYNGDKGLDVGVQDGSFALEVSEEIKSGEGGIWVPGFVAGPQIEGAAEQLQNMAPATGENSELANQTMELGAKALNMVAKDVKQGNIEVYYNRDGSTDFPKNSQGENYKRQLTNEFSLLPKKDINVQVNQNTSFKGKVMIQYTQQKCLENCND